MMISTIKIERGKKRLMCTRNKIFLVAKKYPFQNLFRRMKHTSQLL